MLAHQSLWAQDLDSSVASLLRNDKGRIEIVTRLLTYRTLVPNRDREIGRSRFGYRGYTRHGAISDTAATYTERFLNAFGIDYYLVENDQDADRITIAFAEAARTKRPVAVLVGDEYHGFNR